jgi:hypothetical protein
MQQLCFLWARSVFLGVIFGLGAGALSASEDGNQWAGPWARGTSLTGLGVGAAFGTLSYGGTVRHDWLVFQVQHGVVVSDLLLEDGRLSGQLFLGGEFLWAHQYEPDSGVLFGATPLVRYLFETRSRWKPFVELGIGLGLTDIGGPSLSGTLQLSPQGGVGFFWLLRPDLALGMQQRFIHHSNGGVRSPNAGLNQHVSILSLVRFW